MIYINKGSLSTHYQNKVETKSGLYDIEDSQSRKVAYIQVTKKENAGTINKDAMREAWQEYLKEQEKEFEAYLEGLNS